MSLRGVHVRPGGSPAQADDEAISKDEIPSGVYPEPSMEILRPPADSE